MYKTSLRFRKCYQSPLSLHMILSRHHGCLLPSALQFGWTAVMKRFFGTWDAYNMGNAIDDLIIGRPTVYNYGKICVLVVVFSIYNIPRGIQFCDLFWNPTLL